MRRLGVGGRGGGGDRPLRAQLVVALVVGLILLAVPLYLWQRPGVSSAPPDAGPVVETAVAAASAAVVEPSDAAAATKGVTLGPVQRVKCSASAAVRGQEGELCDVLEPLEAAFREAIAQTVECAPKTGSEGTINYVLALDFRAKKSNVFPGASGEWKGPQARRAAACVEKALAQPDWENVRHQYSYYMIAILATYPGPQPIPGPPGAPVFE